MEFDEMKKIWDSQNSSALYVIDEEAMHRSIKKKLSKGVRLANLGELMLMGSSILAIIIVFAGAYIAENYGIFVMVCMGIFLMSLGYVIYHRNRRKKENTGFERTMLGDMEYAIHTSEAQVKLSGIMLYVFVPLISMVTIGTYFLDDDFSVWYLIGIIIFMGATAIGARYEYRYYVRRRDDLRNMKAKLLEEVER
jgi:predicted permease